MTGMNHDQRLSISAKGPFGRLDVRFWSPRRQGAPLLHRSCLQCAPRARWATETWQETSRQEPAEATRIRAGAFEITVRVGCLFHGTRFSP